MRHPTEPYQLYWTAEYSRDLTVIEAVHGSLGRLLETSLYRVLRRDPREGTYHKPTGLWIVRRKVLSPLLMVQIAYRILEERKQVDLVAIRVIDTTVL